MGIVEYINPVRCTIKWTYADLRPAGARTRERKFWVKKEGFWLAAPEGFDHLHAGKINIDDSQPGEGSAEGGLVPQVLKGGDGYWEVVKVPPVGPGKDGQEEADFEGEQGEGNA